MYVEKVVLHNFKSFKGSNVVFDSGFNAVVGPNGSGKSNIIDSLLFAFGETSLKSMRVKKTPDLIFGTQKMAEVAVTLNDKDGKKHEVRRLVRRDGKTKYLLDGKRVKKYVLEEFLSTNSILLTNIIKQGEVQRIVEMNPKDRRTLIDNVANISEYESKKKEALGELDKVEKRLGEAAAILAERQGFLEELEQEKKDAERFVALDGELKQLRATILNLDVRVYEGDYDALVKSSLERDSQLAGIFAKIQDASSRIDKVNSQKEAIATQILSRGEGKEVQLEREITELNNTVARAKEMSEEKRQFLERSQGRRQDLSLQHNRSADAVQDSIRHRQDVTVEFESLQKQLAEETKAYDAIVSQSQSFSQDFHTARQQVVQLEAEMLASKERLAVVQAELGKNTEVRGLKSREHERLERGRVDDLSPQRQALKAKQNENRKELERVDTELQKLLLEERKLAEKIPALEEEVLRCKERTIELNARIKAAQHTESGRALEAVMGLGFKGVYGTLETLCKYEARYSVPIQTAFGNRATHLVVDSVQTAGKAIDYLKKNRLGRVSFVPLDRIRSSPASKQDEQAASAKGAKGFLLDYVTYDKKYAAAFQYAFGNTVLFDSLPALEPWVGKARGVTMEGELAESSGLISGGTAMQRPSVFKDRKDLEEYEYKLIGATQEKGDVVKALAELREAILPLRKMRAEVELAGRSLELEFDSLKAQEERTREAQKNVMAALEKLASELKEVDTATSNLEDERGTLIRSLSDLNLKLLDVKQRVDLEKEQTLGAKVKEREKRLSDMRINVAALQNRIEALGSELSMRERERDLNASQAQELEAQCKEAEDAIKHATLNTKECQKILKEKVAEQRKFASAIQDLLDEREKLEKELAKIGNEKGKLEFEREKIQSNQQDLAVKKAVLEQKLVDLKAQLQEYASVLVMEGAKVEDKPELAAKAKEIEVELKTIGSVNLKAIEQYDSKLKDYGEQLQRVTQLRSEKDSILSLIKEIEGRKVTVFMNTFNVINQSFQNLFSTIFQGTGTLFLENPENPFEGGLTIQVQLEKKEVKYLELMSGGEKSLIALLFLFAIQSYSPSAVYILDEADAALDQENSRKLSLLVQRLAKDSQFLVVSHNEAVYKNADCLVGVAMSRDGSKLVEVKLTDGSGASIDKSSVPAAPAPVSPELPAAVIATPAPSPSTQPVPTEQNS